MEGRSGLEPEAVASIGILTLALASRGQSTAFVVLKARAGVRARRPRF
jgi:hypothetical protein